MKANNNENPLKSWRKLAGKGFLITLGIKRFQFYTPWTWGPQVLKNSAQQGDFGKTDKDSTGNLHPTGNGQEEYSEATHSIQVFIYWGS